MEVLLVHSGSMDIAVYRMVSVEDTDGVIIHDSKFRFTGKEYLIWGADRRHIPLTG